MTHNLSFRYHADTTKGLRLGLGSAKVEVLQTLYKAKSPATLVPELYNTKEMKILPVE